MLFNEKDKGCTIYEDRPLECRVLKCWDTGEIKRVYAKNRLTRKDLISSIEGLWELVEGHQGRCSYNMLQLFIDAFRKDNRREALEGILNIIEYDKKIRSLTIQKAGIDPEMTDFLFGCPITETIKIYGIKIKEKKGKYIIVPMT